MNIRNSLSSDNPLTDPKEDKLGYAPFAKHLTKALWSMAPVEGLVVAIHGPWGSGKSTVLNFVLYYLKQGTEEEQPIVVLFNPWWFSGQEDLTRLFFDQFQVRLKGPDFKKLKSTLADFAEFVSKIPYIPGGGVGEVFARRLRKQKDLPDLKEKIGELLKKQNKKILVVIDDIDRLDSDEVRHLFRMIKAVANFPNVIYLLAFDKEVVITALEQEQGISGQDYLEKLVQVPFELPLPDKSALRRLLFSKLDAVIAEAGLTEQDFDTTYWSNVYYDGIDGFIMTPRSIVRLTNALQVTYPAIKDEVNPVDFIAIEALRVFCSTAYDIVRRNPYQFVGSASYFEGIPSPEACKLFHEGLIGQLPAHQQASVKKLLSRLFPKFAQTYGGSRYGPEWESKWRKGRHIRSKDIFPVYFRLAVPEGEITNAEIRTYLATTTDPATFGETLRRLSLQIRPDGTSRVRAFLERLEDYTEDIPAEHISYVIQAFFDVGDYLLRREDEPKGTWLFFDNGMYISRIVYQLLSRLDETNRFSLLKHSVEYGKSLYTVVDRVVLDGQEHGRFGNERPIPEPERQVTPEHLAELEQAALQRIRAAGQDGSLQQTPNLDRVLHYWKNWSGDDSEVKQFVEEVISRDAGLITIIEAFLTERRIQTVGDIAVRMEPRLDPSWLEPFLDPDKVIERVRRLLESADLTEKQQTALTQFVEEYDLRQQSKARHDQ